MNQTVIEARERGWPALQNGDLLDVAEAAGFEGMVTSDQRNRISAKPSNEAGPASYIEVQIPYE